METQNNSFFSPIANTKPFLKIGFEGDPGTGKSWTAALVAIGIHKKIGSVKPIVILDTEKAAKFLLPLFEEHKIEAVVKESRSLADFTQAVKICTDGYSDVMLVDSITHIWMDFQEAYQRKVNRKLFQIQDWMIIKSDWNKNFSNVIVQSPLHIIATGRISDRMEQSVDEETGRKEFTKTGVKMQSEKNTAYEFDILVLMERHELITQQKREVWRQATVLKGRGNMLDGMVFKNPTWSSFEPAFDIILANPAQKEMTETDAGTLIEIEDRKRLYVKERDRWLEEIEGLLTSVAPGQTSTEKKAKVDMLFEAFNTASWTAIQSLSPQQIKDGYEKIRGKLLDESVIAYSADQTIITVIKKVEAKNNPVIEAEIKETIKKSSKMEAKK